MSIQQGLISPVLSGRTYKSDQPRVQNVHKAAISAVNVFGPASSTSSSAHHHTKPFVHTIRSPVKKHNYGLAHADRAQPPLTPPMSKDVRHDQHAADHDDPAGHYRTDSQGDHFDAPARSCQRVSARLMAPAPIDADHLHTLTQGFECESDEEHNPFLDPRSNTVSTWSAAHAHHSHPYYDEFDSDQDAQGSVDGDAMDCTADHHDATPRASASWSSNATTPPPAPRHTFAYRPARPFSERVRVPNQAVSSTMPIRDTPKNPFLAGGPADNGFHGPDRHAAYRRAQQIPGKERGKITYVFRGQKVTYPDPENDSDDDDDDDDDSELDEQRAKTNEFNPHHNPDRPPRLQPRLLFPPNASISQAQRTTNGRRGQPIAAYAPVQDEFGGATSSSSSSYDDDEERTTLSPRIGGGGLFAAQIAAQRQPRGQRQQAAQSLDAHRDTACDIRERGEARAPSSSARLLSVTRDTSGERADDRQAARDALLARLDQTNWSDDDEEDRDHGGAPTLAAADEQHEQRPHTNHSMADRQGHGKRPSEHELQLQPGHAGEVDVLGRPRKRSRASYAY